VVDLGSQDFRRGRQWRWLFLSVKTKIEVGFEFSKKSGRKVSGFSMGWKE
jgi:hypothetical protein